MFHPTRCVLALFIGMPSIMTGSVCTMNAALMVMMMIMKRIIIGSYDAQWMNECSVDGDDGAAADDDDD